MSTPTVDLLSELQAVEQSRRGHVISGLLSTVAVGQLFFAAFAFGHARGPMPLRALEVLAGMSFALMASIFLAGLFRRRRLERGANSLLRLQEGRRRRRVALFDGYFSIDDEVVLASAVQSAEVNSGRLLLRYVDPAHSGPVLRELEGRVEDLEQLLGATQA